MSHISGYRANMLSKNDHVSGYKVHMSPLLWAQQMGKVGYATHHPSIYLAGGKVGLGNHPLTLLLSLPRYKKRGGL